MKLLFENDSIKFEGLTIEYPTLHINEFHTLIQNFLLNKNKSDMEINNMFKTYGFLHDINTEKYIFYDKQKKRTRINIKIPRKEVRSLLKNIDPTKDYRFFSKDFYLQKAFAKLSNGKQNLIKTIRSFTLFSLHLELLAAKAESYESRTVTNFEGIVFLMSLSFVFILYTKLKKHFMA